MRQKTYCYSLQITGTGYHHSGEYGLFVHLIPPEGGADSVELFLSHSELSDLKDALVKIEKETANGN